VLAEGKRRPVELAFGSATDLRSISHWRMPAPAPGHSAVRDTVEFARLASKRFRYYLRSIPTATSFRQLNALISRNPEAEVSFLLLARANWFRRSSILGLAQCRRTYCHHIVLEFLSVHPAIVGAMPPRIFGVGTGIVYGLAELAGQLSVKLVWGEATANSAPFYSHILQARDVKDQFAIRGRVLDRCRYQFHAKLSGTLD
jgi:hypothetical protein